jgi:hypothetical protein
MRSLWLLNELDIPFELIDMPFDLNARQTPPFRAGKDSADAEGIHCRPSKAFVAARCSIKKILG